jgi:hypothetical protein
MISTPCEAQRQVHSIQAMAFAILALVPAMPAVVHGQYKSATLEIIAPAEIRMPAGVEIALPIRVVPVEAVPKQAILLIRGLPPVVALSEGRVFDSGIWTVRITDLPKLRIAVPSDARGRADLALSVVTFDGVVMAESRSSLVLAIAGAAAESLPAQQPTAWTNAGTPPALNDKPPAAPAPPLPPPAKSIGEIENLMLLMRRGDESMTRGKVNDARLFYARAAENGWAPAALALAMTYDAKELAQMAVLGGVLPNVDMAAKWYRRAHELGSQEATEKLQRLGQN